MLFRLKVKIKDLIKAEKEHAKLLEMHSYCSDMMDKRNYNPERAEKIRSRIGELSTIIGELKIQIGI